MAEFPLRAAIERVEMYHNENGIDLTCACGTELIPMNTSTTVQLLDAVEAALEHRKSCLRA